MHTDWANREKRTRCARDEANATEYGERASVLETGHGIELIGGTAGGVDVKCLPKHVRNLFDFCGQQL